jgi:hypothetical protein
MSCNGPVNPLTNPLSRDLIAHAAGAKPPGASNLSLKKSLPGKNIRQFCIADRKETWIFILMYYHISDYLSGTISAESKKE